MDENQFVRLLRDNSANQWRMFWVNQGIWFCWVMIFFSAFYITTRSDLHTLLIALESASRSQTSSGNSVNISHPPARTVSDNAHAILKKQGLVE